MQSAVDVGGLVYNIGDLCWVYLCNDQLRCSGPAVLDTRTLERHHRNTTDTMTGFCQTLFEVQVVSQIHNFGDVYANLCKIQ